MGMVTARDKKILSQLVQDCLLYGLNEQESLEYVEKRSGGFKIPRSTFYSIKKRICRLESDMLQHRLNEHTRVGFALNHFRHIQGLESVQKVLFQTLIDEVLKTVRQEDLVRYLSTSW